MKLTKEYIRDMITTDYAWTVRAVVALYEQQTEDEKFAHTTKQTNGVGFSKYDVEFLSSIAVQVRGGATLTEKQLVVVRKKINKYAGQLLRLTQLKEIIDA